ncbi:YncE family protein [Marinobacter salexigens]|uniref:YncE family protein n=1 Tax=Marinobacter salexigens TaxID=1925763 RepID=UPI000C2886EC|nr:beta-propeller fold lactonase family protein [Marinobacter salexigens]
MKLRRQKHWLVGLTASITMSLSLMATADTTRAFIPMGMADSVGVIDLESRQMTSSMSGTVNTHGSALTPDGRYLVAGSLTAHESEKPVSRPEGVTEDEHAAHHGGGAATASEETNTGRLYVMDTATNSISRTLEVPGPVHHVLVTSDGRYAVSTHPMGGGISVVDLDSGKQFKSVATGPAPNYVVETEGGQSLLVSNSGNGTISEVDTTHWFVKRNLRIGGGPEHMVLAPDNERLYVNDVASGQVSVVELASGAVAATYEVGEEPHGVGLSNDGQILFATSKGSNRIVRIELDTGDRHSAPLAPAPYHLAVSPHGGQLLVTSRAESKLWVLEPDSLDIIDEVPLKGIGHQISLGFQ